MHILIIGAAGMVGRKLTAALVASGQVGGSPIGRLTLADVVVPSAPAGFTGKVDTLASDLSAPGAAAALVASRPDLIFHLAAIVSGEADDRIGSAELVNAFHFWLAMRGEGQFKDRTVSTAMKDHARRWRSKKTGQKFHPVKSGGLMAYDGIRFTDFFRKSWADAPKDVRKKSVKRMPS